MTRTQSFRLWLILMVFTIAALIVSLTLYALRQNINLFYTPIELQILQTKPHMRIRVGGMVRKGTLQQGANLEIKFIITDYKAELPVRYTGILPDLFREGQGVVALGIVDSSGNFQAEQILAKHDENYMPPEIASKLQKE